MSRYDLTDFEWRVIEPLLRMNGVGGDSQPIGARGRLVGQSKAWRCNPSAARSKNNAGKATPSTNEGARGGRLDRQS